MHLPEARMAVTIPEAAASLGLSRSYLYQEAKAGRLKVRKAGKRSLVALADLQAFVDALPAK